MPDEAPLNLSAYFDRIGYGGPAAATPAVLNDLQRLHTAAIPFESIDVFLGRQVDISPAAVEQKLVAARRGGYCYEQNGLFRRVLLTLGFEVTALIGRVLWNMPEDAPLRPRTHVALKVRVRGDDWLADVGFGGSTLTAPLLWNSDISQKTPHALYRIVRSAGEITLEQQVDGEWRPVYRLGADAQIPADFEPPNWFSSTHPTSHFKTGLICALSPPGRRINLLNNRLTIRPVGGEVERRTLDAEGIERCLVEEFGLPVEPDWRPGLQRAVQVGEATP